MNEKQVPDHMDSKAETDYRKVLRGAALALLERVGNEGEMTSEDVNRLKLEWARKYSAKRLPKNSEILKLIREDEGFQELIRQPDYPAQPLMDSLRIKPTRTAAGVATVAVMTSPHHCPHGKCICCPGGVENNSPQSYTGSEPAALRAAQHDFDPFRQVRSRLEQYRSIGHAADKVDLIIMGGTFPARDPGYQEEFVKGCFDAMNAGDPGPRIRSGPAAGTPGISPTFRSALERNESAAHRCIGLTIETRPDQCSPGQVDRMLRQGATRVELGVQNVFDDVLEEMERGHTAADTAAATRRLKDAGLKICYHLMPGLPGSSEETDRESFRRVFSDPDFRPDMVKIYPTLVVRGTGLYDMWKRGEYHPLETERAARLVADLKEMLPPYVRIQRIQRDIPLKHIEAGVKKSNLRQLALAELERRGAKCGCIRCREVGLKLAKNEIEHDELMKSGKPELRRIEYDASGGKEIFLSYEFTVEGVAGEERTSEGHTREYGSSPSPIPVLLAYLRLRLPSASAERPEISGSGERGVNTALLRELKVPGGLEPLGRRTGGRWQHRGYGKMLMAEAERIAREEWGCGHMLVNSGVGVRPYYRKLGYGKVGTYMGKRLKD